MNPPITTARLVLRQFSLDDVAPLHRILNRGDVLRYFPNPQPPSLERVENLVNRQLQHWQDHNFGWWAVELRTQPGIIGWNGLQYLPETEEVEIGYLLARPHWGQGLAVEGARLGLQFGFERLGLEEIVALVHPENLASQRVIEKLGMSFTDEAVYFGMNVYRYTLTISNFKSFS